jgi:hypothetical protein
LTNASECKNKAVHRGRLSTNNYILKELKRWEQ